MQGGSGRRDQIGQENGPVNGQIPTIERHQEVERVISVACEGYRSQGSRGDGHAELLVKLPGQGGLRGFVWFDLRVDLSNRAHEELNG